MAIFSTKKEEKQVEASKDAKPKKKAAAAEKSAPKLSSRDAVLAYDVLVAPWVTEKTYTQMAQGKYAFKVAKTATKNQIKKAIEGVYGVKIEKIAVINTHAKAKNYGRYAGQIAGYRKALITLKEGEKIELFSAAK